MSVTTAATVTVGRNVPLEPGQVVGVGADCQWQVVRHIADGGFSSVYGVRPATAPTQHVHGPRHRALKCLWGTPAELSAIGGEAAKMAAVEGHENVLGLIDSFRFDGADRPQAHYVGLVLELAAEDLRHFAARAQPSERAWAAVFEQVAAGLDHIHSRRVVHGDIKPTNVLRIGGRFAIADFGVAAPLETTRSAGIGLARTIAFWPPESASQGVLCADGVRRPPAEGWRATQLGDVWALAVSMHRMLTGRHITPGTTPEQQYELVCLGKYSIDDRLGPGWRQLLADCLVHDPDQRTVSTAGALRARLAELALADDFLGVPWTDGRPRIAAVLDLGAPSAPVTAPPLADHVATRVLDGELATPPGPRDGRTLEQPPEQIPGAPAGPGARPATAGTDPAPEHPPAAGPAPARPRPGVAAEAAPLPASGAGPVPGTGPASGGAAPGGGPGPAAGPGPGGGLGPGAGPGGVASLANQTTRLAPAPGRFGAEPEPPTAVEPAAGGREALLLYLTQEGGRVQGAVVPADGLLLAATRHLSDVAVPSLAQQVRDSQRAVVRLVDEQERLRARSGPQAEDEAARTLIVGAAEVERTRELTVAVADVTRQRDRLAQDRDRLARHRDELAEERDRLRQQYADLARRLDRLERHQQRRDRDLDAAAAARSRREETPVEPPRPPVRGGTTGWPVEPPAVIRVEPPRRRRRGRGRGLVFTLLLLFVLGMVGTLAVSARTGLSPADLVHRVQNLLDSG